MTLAEQKAVVAHTSEAFSDTEPNVVTEAAKAVLKDSEARGGGVQMLGVDKIYHRLLFGESRCAPWPGWKTFRPDASSSAART